MSECIRTGWLLNRPLFLTVPEARSVRSGHRHGQVLVRALIRAADFSLSSRGRRDQGALWGLFYESLHPILEGSSLMTASPPRAPPPMAVALGARIPSCEFGGTQTFRPQGAGLWGWAVDGTGRDTGSKTPGLEPDRMLVEFHREQGRWYRGLGREQRECAS